MFKSAFYINLEYTETTGNVYKIMYAIVYAYFIVVETWIYHNVTFNTEASESTCFVICS